MESLFFSNMQDLGKKKKNAERAKLHIWSGE